jgi:UPF0755 protein
MIGWPVTGMSIGIAMSDEQSRSEEEREAARLERGRKRAAAQGEPPLPPRKKDLPAQAPPIGAGSPRKAKPAAAAARPADKAPQPAPPAKAEQPPTPPTPPRKVTDDDESPSGTIRPGGATTPPPSPQRRRRSPGRHAMLFAIIAVVLVGALFILNGIFEPFKGGGSESVTVKIPAGVDAGDIGTLLADKGVVGSRFFFELRATIGGDRGKLRAGTYELRKSMSNGAALAVLTNVQKGAAVIDVLVPEGPARDEIAPVVAKQGVTGNYVAASVASPQLDPTIYGAPKNVSSLEGFLFPATYELLKSAPTAKRLVSDQLKAFKRNIADVNMSYAKSKNLSVFDVVILASIIEREALFDRDRPLVAAVFYNRLRDSISLGSDATTRFAVRNWDQPLTASQIASKSPYNTRQVAGLPPGPIGNPGLASIEAAANPPKSDYLYFIVAPCKKGALVFAKTLPEFQNLIDAYFNRRAAQGGKDPAFCR